jgi:hypothetical protein
LEAENVDWQNHVISFARKKTGSSPSCGLTKKWRKFSGICRGTARCFRICGAFAQATARRSFISAASAWHQRCHVAQYRYAWAERAKTAGYPERFAQEALGHNSKAVHRAYARKAKVELPSLGEYERQRKAFADGRGIEPVAQATTA